MGKKVGDQLAVYNSGGVTLADGDSTGLFVGADGRLLVDADVTVAGDIEIGAVEIKDGISDNRTSVNSSGQLSVAAAGAVASGATDSGNPVKVGGKYNLTPPTLIDGQRGDIQLDASANERVTLATLIAGEDIPNNVLRVEEHFTYATATGDLLVKSGAGFLHTLTFAPNDSAPTAGSIIIYDNTAESGTQIFNWSGITTTWFVPFTLTLDVIFATGLYIGYTTTGDVNVTASYR
jgi:hypothetical protein